MNRSKKRASLLCPNCRKLVSRSATQCPHCGLRNPCSIWNNNILTGGTAGDQGILRLILIANILMYALSVLIDPRMSMFSGSPFELLSPSGQSLFTLGSSGSEPLFRYNRWWTLLSANYLHGNLPHILFNMVALHQLGPLLLGEYGKHRLVVIYTLSGAGGYFISALFGVPFTIGASASVCGMIGAALYYGKSRGGTFGDQIYRQIGGWAVGIFIFGFVVPGINNWGHGGGMLCGALLGFLLGYRERRPETMLHKYISMACITTTGLALLWSMFLGVLFLLVSPYG